MTASLSSSAGVNAGGKDVRVVSGEVCLATTGLAFCGETNALAGDSDGEFDKGSALIAGRPSRFRSSGLSDNGLVFALVLNAGPIFVGVCF